LEDKLLGNKKATTAAKSSLFDDPEPVAAPAKATAKPVSPSPSRVVKDPFAMALGDDDDLFGTGPTSSKGLFSGGSAPKPGSNLNQSRKTHFKMSISFLTCIVIQCHPNQLHARHHHVRPSLMMISSPRSTQQQTSTTTTKTTK